MRVPMSSPALTEVELRAVQGVLESCYLSCGSQLKAFETAVAAYAGVPFGVGVNSGTSGLHLCIIAAGIGQGDLVLTTPFSFIASANCVLYERGIPVFVDVEPETGNIDPALVAEAAQDLRQGGSFARRWLPPALRDSSPRGTLKAILPVHVFGQPADMDALLTTADKYNLHVIEDACEALGACYKGRAAGSLGQAAVFAFYPNKQITTGEGGMIVTSNKEWADLFCSLRNQGRDIFDAWLNHARLGYNYRLDEMSAAVGRVQMSRLEELIAGRAQVAAWYAEQLAGNELVELPAVASSTSRASWFVYVIRLRPPAQRNRVLQRLAELRIPSRPYFSPIHLQPFYQKEYGYRRGDFPVTEYLGDVSLALPFSAVMTSDQVHQVCDALQQALKSY